MNLKQHLHQFVSRSRKLLLMTAVSSALITQASAQCLVTTEKINTGWDPATNTVITPGTGNQDPNWYISALSPALVPIAAPNSPNYNAYVVTPGFQWLSSPTAGWLNIITANGFPTTPGNLYQATFSRNFTLCKNDSITFNLQIANDNYCPAIRVDGVAVPPSAPFSPPPVFAISNYASYSTLPSFTIALTAGVHTIDVDVVDIDVSSGNNPMGLNMIGNIISASGTPSIVFDGCREFNCQDCHSGFTYCVNTANPFSYNFSADDPLQSSYTWTIDGVASGNTPNINKVFPGPGSHQVCLTVKTAKGTQCRTCIMVCIADNPRQRAAGNTQTGVKPVQETVAEALKVYPNPTNSDLNVEFHNAADNNVDVKLYDITGKLVSSQSRFMQAGDQKLTINMTKLAAGTYMLELTNGTDVSRQQVVKK